MLVFERTIRKETKAYFPILESAGFYVTEGSTDVLQEDQTIPSAT
jgi:hypothetical protein